MSKLASMRKGPRDMAARAIVLGLLGRIQKGALIVDDGGKRHLCGRPVPGEPVPELTVISPKAWAAVATDGSSGLGRAYVNGWWTCATLDELVMVLRVVVRNLDAIERASAVTKRVSAPIRHALAKPDSQLANHDLNRRKIGSHYDTGNEFFELLLDETMSYSSAFFSSPGEDLHDAQTTKLDRICRRLALSPADNVIEIGTGWGSFAIYAATRYGCKVTAATTSPSQYALANERVVKAGLQDLVTVVDTDYPELTGIYDKLVSIETLGSVDWRNYGDFFSKCSQLLEPDGMMAIQTVVIGDDMFDHAKHSQDFVKAYVFPNSCMPSISVMVAEVSKSTDMRMVSLEDIGKHYAETVHRWRSNLAKHSGELAGIGVDDGIAKLFEFYFAYCEAGSAERRISDIQCIFAKPEWRPSAIGARNNA